MKNLITAFSIFSVIIFFNFTAQAQNISTKSRSVIKHSGVTNTIVGKYAGKWGQIRRFEGPEFVYTDKSGIWIMFHSPGELLLIDPLGRRLGFDPIGGATYNEIPQAVYRKSGLVDDTDPNSNHEGDPSYFKEIEIGQPIEGNYQLNVIGTGTGTYDLGIQAYDLQSNLSTQGFLDIAISPNLVHKYNFTFSKAVGSKIKVFGGFDGGGQRPKDVNKFLSYANPSESQTNLPASTTTFPLHIFYGSAIISNTFKAELNGVDISTLFRPIAGEDQVVTLNLSSGRNVLVLSVNGQLPTRVATDTDRLVFKVQ